MSTHQILQREKRQNGVVLFTVLIFLIALTLLALASMRGSTLGERIARNSVDKVLAYQAAEAALRDAESDIVWKLADGTSCEPAPTSPPSPPASPPAPCRPITQRPVIGSVNVGFQGDPNCTVGQCFPLDPKIGFAIPVWQDKTQWTRGIPYGTYTRATPIPTVARQPIYLIEGFQTNGQWKTFRITAIGFGADQNSQVMLQSIFAPAL
ncbi:MAG: hypothetical protein K5Q00_05910 [Gammaproteobacteria bacterium]|nr:hypothetical protein [Gammaproteobacteria bacterium]